jgi:serine/threonine protein phosphatase PrpC
MKIKVSSFQKKNTRGYCQQDSFMEDENPQYWLSPIAGVFDGHGDHGNISHILETLKKVPPQLEDRVLKEYEKPKILNLSGSTMCAFYLQMEDLPILWVINMGDTRAVMYTENGAPIPIWQIEQPDNNQNSNKTPVINCHLCTIDHAFGMGINKLRPSQSPEWWMMEKENVEKIGGTVVNVFGNWRVDGRIMLSRSLFDRERNLIREPDVYSIKLIKSCIFVIASDGVWDVLSLEDVGMCISSPVQFLGKRFGDMDGHLIRESIQLIENYEEDSKSIANFIVNMARLSGSSDDITCQIVEIML